jgi:hypothetical protein
MSFLLCQRYPLENGLQELIFREASHTAIDEWMQHQEAMIQEFANESAIRILISIPQTLPIQYTMNQARSFNAKYPQRPLFLTAFLHPPDPMMSLVTPMINAFTATLRDRVKFFPQTQREKALQWLSSG